MAVFNKKNALIGWAVLEGARVATGKRGGKAEVVEEKPKRHRFRKLLATTAGAAVAVGGLAALRRRRGVQGTEE